MIYHISKIYGICNFALVKLHKRQEGIDTFTAIGSNDATWNALLEAAEVIRSILLLFKHKKHSSCKKFTTERLMHTNS